MSSTGEDTVLLIGVTAQATAELYALLGSEHTRDVLALEDVLELYLLYARIERAVVDVERGGDAALVLCRENHLTALGRNTLRPEWPHRPPTS